MLGVVWRESVYNGLQDGEYAITLAALLHVDHEGKPFVSALIEKSGLTVEEWVKQLAKSNFTSITSLLVSVWYCIFTAWAKYGACAKKITSRNV
ncbi:hypothetical protein GCM10020331_090060 [Ectobacillus funiculus]